MAPAILKGILAAAVIAPGASLKSHRVQSKHTGLLRAAHPQVVPNSNHIKAVRRDSSNAVRTTDSSSGDDCSQVSDILASRNDTSLAREMWDIACNDRYECQRPLPQMAEGCMYVAPNKRLAAMLDTIGRPNPCSFHDMVSNSFFVKGECPDNSQKEVTSHGGVTYESCDGGLVTHDATCAKASPIGTDEQIRTGEGSGGIRIFVTDAVIGAPEPWEKVMLKRAMVNEDQATEVRNKAIAEASSIVLSGDSPSVRVEFYACGKEGALTDTATLQNLAKKQVEVLQQAHAGQCSCESMVYEPSFFNTGITFKDFNPDTDLKFIDDSQCKMCDWSYDNIWKEHMPAERGVAKVLIADPASVLGISAFPWDASSPRGTMINWRTMPGGGLNKYDQGKTVVHELGHYFGLYHTFQDSCSPGDGIEDTDPEERPYFGCPGSSRPPKSCNSDSPDPVHMFMDYSDDRCMCAFSHDQVDLMQRMKQKYIDA